MLNHYWIKLLSGSVSLVFTQLKWWSLEHGLLTPCCTGGGEEGLDRPLASWGFMGCTGRNLPISSRQLLAQDARLHFRTKICRWKTLAPASFLKITCHAFPAHWLCCSSTLMNYSPWVSAVFPSAPWPGYLPRTRCGLTLPVAGPLHSTPASCGAKETREVPECQLDLSYLLMSFHPLEYIDDHKLSCTFCTIIIS